MNPLGWCHVSDDHKAHVYGYMGVDHWCRGVSAGRPLNLPTKPLLLDLFCGAGGAAVGYALAGFAVVGVDIKPQPNYPFRFIQDDISEWERVPTALFECDVIHASPPCQRYSDLAKRNGNAESHPDLIEPVRRLLEDTFLPYVIENVEGAPLHDPVTLCGTMFPGLRVLRHRLFESNIWLGDPPVHQPHPLCYTRDKRKAHYGQLDEMAAFVTVTGGGNCSVKAARDAMWIDWMTKDELNEAIPPKYTQWVGRKLLAHLATGDEPCAEKAAA